VAGKQTKGGSNHIAEWYGHRVFPEVAATSDSLADQHAKRCPFISEATGETHTCVKRPNSQGVCTISSHSNGSRQDWLVCPFRALDLDMLEDASRRMYGYSPDVDLDIVAATVLTDASRRAAVVQRVNVGLRTLVYFQNKLGGEISIGSTPRSPEFSFDATVIELLPADDGAVRPGRYGIIEIQTMDFHGTYARATENLRSALHMHSDDFAVAISDHPEWLAEKIEAPNIANVFKRTFYQMMFKFQIGAHASCAGCVFAIPKSVWDSWQRHLGAPTLVDRGDGTWQLGTDDPTLPSTGRAPAWIYVFDIAASDLPTPNDLVLWRVIATDAATMSHYALDVAPEAALEEGGAVDRLAATIHGRLSPLMGASLATLAADGSTQGTFEM
jgi:hypothetical protein